MWKKAKTIGTIFLIIIIASFMCASCSKSKTSESSSEISKSSYSGSSSKSSCSSGYSGSSSKSSSSSGYSSSYSKSSSSFTNKYGTATTICAHAGCTNYIASSGDTNCCTKHSNRCLGCKKYIDEDAMYCMSCLTKYLYQ